MVIWEGSNSADGCRVFAGANFGQRRRSSRRNRRVHAYCGIRAHGSDDADPKLIGDPAKCVFASKNEIFRLNNVHTDRITVQGWQRQQGLEQWVTIELHGDDVVFEETTEPLKDDASEKIRRLRAAMPDVFTSHHNTYKEQNCI
jgi:hypothetical protein